MSFSSTGGKGGCKTALMADSKTESSLSNQATSIYTSFTEEH